MGYNHVFRGNFRTGLDTVWVGSVALISFISDMRAKICLPLDIFHKLINESSLRKIIFRVQRAQP